MAGRQADLVVLGVEDRTFLEAQVRHNMSPPNPAVVLCMDEKSQIQALDREQPVLPIAPGVPERRIRRRKLPIRDQFPNHWTRRPGDRLNMISLSL